MKTFVGKNTQLKQAAVGHVIMQAGRSRTFIVPFKYVLVCNCTNLDPDFHRMLKGSILIMKKISEISKDDNSRNADTLWKLSCLLYPTAPAWNDIMQLVHHGKYPSQSSILQMHRAYIRRYILLQYGVTHV